MKPAKLLIGVGATLAVLCMTPDPGWSTRAYGAAIGGEVTAAPVNGEIEIAHHSYRIKAGSAADKALSSFYAGESVDAVLDGPADSSASQVIALTPHSAS